MGRRSGPFGDDAIGAHMSPTDFLAAMSDRAVISWLRQFQIVRPDPPRQFTIADFAHACMLEPYLRAAWKEIEGEPGLPGRIAQMQRVYDLAQRRLHRDSAVPVQNLVIDFPSFARAYADGNLNHAAGPVPR